MQNALTIVAGVLFLLAAAIGMATSLLYYTLRAGSWNTNDWHARSRYSFMGGVLLDVIAASIGVIILYNEPLRACYAGIIAFFGSDWVLISYLNFRYYLNAVMTDNIEVVVHYYED